jgi:mannose-6-phosphate isomerase-like protein (cupin superfamily)
MAYHHRKLPHHSTLLSGRAPRDAAGFRSEQLQIWYNHTDKNWADEMSHAHTQSDECFIVLQGELVVEVEGERFTVGPREFCCFPRGQYHAIIEVHPPVETLMIRAPSVNDKIYLNEQTSEVSKTSEV